MTQTLALLLDAYRDLNSRKMFWIVLILSCLVAGAFGGVGLHPYGFSIFNWHIQSPLFNSNSISPGEFYKYLFVNLGIEIWLTWAAAVLALISTATIFPDFIAGGAVDLYLAKPIGRLRLFLTKYLCGLLFVALQVFCFCTASFLVIGLRGGSWMPGIYIAVPIVTLFFSYLYCVCVLLGVLWRSTIAAVLLTLLFWIAVYGVHQAEITLLLFQIHQDNNVAQMDREISSEQAAINSLTRSAAHPTTQATERLHRLQADLLTTRNQRDASYNSFVKPHLVLYAIKTFFPKTEETVTLLHRVLIKQAKLMTPQISDDDNNNSNSPVGSPQDIKKLGEVLRNRPVSWIVGTSVAFEVVVLSLAAWVFCRRDY